MNFGFRYHLASLMAIFLSLILGILIGGALFPDNALVEEQGQLISDLEDYFVLMQNDLHSLNLQIAASDNAWAELRDRLLENRLVGKTIVVIGESYDDNNLGEILRLTGAQIKSINTEVLPLVAPDENFFFVARLTEEELTKNLLDNIHSLVDQGGNMVFVWDNEVQPPLQGLPYSLQIDSVDTMMGQIALILGMLTEGRGHYGLHKDSKGLFPL